MPRGLKRYQEADELHFITFSCHRRQPFLGSARARQVFVRTLGRVQAWYGLAVFGYVVMPEHVHLLVCEPERGSLRAAIQMLKQITAHKLLPTLSSNRPDKSNSGTCWGPRSGDKGGAPEHFWQARYYDFNVWTKKKRIEKLGYMHRNPVKRGLVEKPEDWRWSSFRHYMTGEEGVVEIESEWTGRKRERLGMVPRVTELVGNR